jgi:hypothetical protein
MPTASNPLNIPRVVRRLLIDNGVLNSTVYRWKKVHAPAYAHLLVRAIYTIALLQRENDTLRDGMRLLVQRPGRPIKPRENPYAELVDPDRLAAELRRYLDKEESKT